VIRTGHILLKLREGVETRAPVHLDVMDGAHRPGATVDGHGPVDRALLARTSGLRAKRSFHAARSLRNVGARHSQYDAEECALGLDRVLGVQVADPENTWNLVEDLRALDQVEWAMAEPLATAPLRRGRSRGQEMPAQAITAAAFERVGAAEALRIEPGSRSVAVAVIDTGVALEHREFARRLLTGYDTVDLGMGLVAEGVSLVGDSLGRDFCARDETGHGSHVAGIIGARGLAMSPGIGGFSPLIPVRALAAARSGADGPVFGVGGISDIDAAIKVAVDMGAKVLNMSFGTSGNVLDPFSEPPHADVMAYAEERRCICVAAMGNSGIEEDYFPAADPRCIAVGSMTLDGRRSDFSTTGRHIALCAPGEHVFSAGLAGYGESSGTSHAAPFVSGAVALLAARARARGHNLSGAEARMALCYSADGDTANPETGWGMLDIPAALALLDHMTLETLEDTR
jgi:subtilisin family serine protease